MIICLKTLTFVLHRVAFDCGMLVDQIDLEQGFFKKPFLQINAKSMHFLCKDSIGKGDPLRAVMSVGRQPCDLYFIFTLNPFLGCRIFKIFFSHKNLDLRAWRMPNNNDISAKTTNQNFIIFFLSLVFHENYMSFHLSNHVIDWLFVHYWNGKSFADVICFWFARDLASSLFSISA